jgi:TonB family protein
MYLSLLASKSLLPLIMNKLNIVITMRFVAFAFLLFLTSTVVAQQPEFKGGLENFVTANTIYPPYALHNCIQGSIRVSFKLNTTGKVVHASITEGLGVDLDEEALRLIQLTSGKWTLPVKQDTSLLYVVPVNFKLEGYNCERKTIAEIAKAIQDYKDEKNLEEVVSNYYKNKERSDSNAADEPRILQIKRDLGIDEDYLESRLEAGLKKYKQGDKQGACKEFTFVKYMGFSKANEYLSKYCN